MSNYDPRDTFRELYARETAERAAKLTQAKQDWEDAAALDQLQADLEARALPEHH